MIFKCAGTAANYISYVGWACRIKELSMEWRDGVVSFLLQGLDKRVMRECPASLRLRVLLDDGLGPSTR